MQRIDTVAEMRALSARLRAEGRRIGFVPTMGYLHEGHLSLVREARRRADVVVTSIYVNPTQFGAGEDLDRYPRDLDRDARLLEELNNDVLFFPSGDEMYPADAATFVSVRGGLTAGMCGASRPVHFRGVATVVTKLFTVVQPHVAVFGQKDYQQLLVVQRMARDLLMDVEVVGAPIVREPDGLAMSSRNVYLTPEQRARAVGMAKGLQRAARDLSMGGLSPAEARAELKAIIEAAGGEVDYVVVVDADTLQACRDLPAGRRAVVALAARFGQTRLIDNAIIERA
jgi:pantoate--beta-alanine ligase